MASDTGGSDGMTFKLDFAASTFAIDCTGESAAFRSRQGLAIVDLSNPTRPSKIITLSNKRFETLAAVEYNPHIGCHSQLACTNLETVAVYDCSSGQESFRTGAHKRPVTDISWSPFDYHLISSTSQDCDIHVWDARDSRKPIQTFYGWTSGALQVKWNRIDENIIASAHGHEVKIWDRRKKDARAFITAHMLHIYGLDWSYTNEEQLVTCSQDKQAKLWHVTEKTARATIQAASPVWRARFTPFGEGVVIMPRDEKCLTLWDPTDLSSPVYVFDTQTKTTIESSDHIKEFAWRTRKSGGETRYQVVAMTKNQNVCLWDINDTHQMLGKSRRTESSRYPSVPGTPSQSLRSVDPTSLQQEFSHVEKLPNVRIEDANVVNRTCTLTVGRLRKQVSIKINFPSAYPRAPPSFEVISRSMSVKNRSKFSEVLRTTANQCVEQAKQSLKYCVDAVMYQISILPDVEVTPQEPHHAVLPCPRTSGFCFSADNKILTFVNFPGSKVHTSDQHPRTLADLTAWVEGRKSTPRTLQITDTPEYSLNLSDYQVSSMALETEEKLCTTTVGCSDISRLSTFSKTLATEYALSGRTAQEVCEANAQAAAAVGRRDAEQAWKLLQSATDPKLWGTRFADPAWMRHPCGGKLIQRLVLHFIRQADVQTAAIIGGVLLTAAYRNLPPQRPGVRPLPQQPTLPRPVIHALACARMVYGDLLFRNSLHQQFSDLMKAAHATNKEPFDRISFDIACVKCRAPTSVDSPICARCNSLRFPCSVCLVATRGLSIYCSLCQHGGHLRHLQQWFSKHDVCATGCGCHCSLVEQ